LRFRLDCGWDFFCFRRSPKLPQVIKHAVILSEAKNLSWIAAIEEGFFASLRMTIRVRGAIVGICWNSAIAGLHFGSLRRFVLGYKIKIAAVFFRQGLGAAIAVANDVSCLTGGQQFSRFVVQDFVSKSNRAAS